MQYKKFIVKDMSKIGIATATLYGYVNSDASLKELGLKLFRI